MDSRTDKKLDEFTENLLEDFSRETPSFDFTTQVMSKVEALSDSQITEYKPLISKRIWAVLAILVLGAFSFLIFGNVQMESSLLSAIQADVRSNLQVLNFPDLLDYEISIVFLYAIIGFTFFVSIQILLLKSHFNKRFA